MSLSTFEDVGGYTGQEIFNNSFWIVAASIVIASCLSYNILYNLFFSPLSPYPGPRLWAVSSIPYQMSIMRGRSHLKMLALHDHYGPVLRVGPSELSFNTPQAFRDIYGFRPGRPQFPKDPKLYASSLNGVRDSVAGYLTDEAHTRQRRLLSHAFSGSSLREQERVIVHYVDLLIERLRDRAQRDKTRETIEDMKNWFNFVTFDITGDLMFGETFDCLKDSKMHPWIALVFSTLKGITFLTMINQFALLRKIQGVFLPESLRRQMLKNFNLSAQKADRRLEKGTSRPDFMSAILKHGLSDAEGRFIENRLIMSRAEIHANSVLFTIAGSETTASLLSSCIYYLCKHPNVLDQLYGEVHTAFSKDGDIIPPECAHLKYLNAVIEESLRLYPPLVTNLPRLVPKGGDIVDGHSLPEDITVSTHHYASYHSAANFVLPEQFIPERWLGTDPRFNLDKRDVVKPFSLGPRNCLGKNMAYLETRLILCKLIFNFGLELCPESEKWTDQEVYLMWDKPALMVRLIDKFA